MPHLLGSVVVGEGEKKEDDYLLNEWTEWTGEASLDLQVLAQTNEESPKENERRREDAKETGD
jgi:hypothetical protein